ncbi:hypothetical protein LPH60_00040 [Xylella taiwanensis]|nr:hypothetical protein [Xylella taiwanensis]MCD8468832.1 hypothetical protein [Xylella taiwanensis]
MGRLGAGVEELAATVAELLGVQGQGAAGLKLPSVISKLPGLQGQSVSRAGQHAVLVVQ